MWKPLADERAAKIALLERRLLEREDTPAPPWPSERTITVILTVHGDKRIKMALEAYRSIIAAGFKPSQIRICLTSPPNGYGNVNVFPDDGHVTDMLGQIDNNSAWLQSCERAESSHITILHDDDLMKPGLAAKLKERDDWEVAYWDAEQIGDINNLVAYFKCKPGVYDGAVVREIQAENSLTISTVQGCFPRHIAVEAFSQFGSEFNQPEFLFHPGMWVGNDFLLWWLAGSSKKVWLTGEVFSGCRGHSGSTTSIGLHNGTIRPMYDEMRKRIGASVKKRIIVGHSFGNVDKFCRSFEAVKTKHPVTFLCHSGSQRIPSNCNRVVVPDIGLKIKQPTGVLMKDHCAKFIFAQACKIALDGGFDEMLWIETDCRVTGDQWDDCLRQEHAGAGDVACSGTPVGWSLFSDGAKTAKAAIDFAHSYQSKTGRLMAIEGPPSNSQPCVFPNGAIAWYSSELMDECFASRITPGWENVSQPEPFDLAVGRYLWSRYAENAFKKIGMMASSYSGCGDHWYGLNDRLQMLSSGQIVAVHQVKQ